MFVTSANKLPTGPPRWGRGWGEGGFILNPVSFILILNPYAVILQRTSYPPVPPGGVGAGEREDLSVLVNPVSLILIPNPPVAI